MAAKMGTGTAALFFFLIAVGWATMEVNAAENVNFALETTALQEPVPPLTISALDKEEVEEKVVLLGTIPAEMTEMAAMAEMAPDEIRDRDRDRGGSWWNWCCAYPNQIDPDATAEIAEIEMEMEMEMGGDWSSNCCASNCCGAKIKASNCCGAKIKASNCCGKGPRHGPRRLIFGSRQQFKQLERQSERCGLELDEKINLKLNQVKEEQQQQQKQKQQQQQRPIDQIRKKWIVLGLSSFAFFSMVLTLLVFWSLKKQRKAGIKGNE